MDIEWLGEECSRVAACLVWLIAGDQEYDKDLVFFARYYRYNLWWDVRMRVAHPDVLREHREVMRKVRDHEKDRGLDFDR